MWSEWNYYPFPTSSGHNNFFLSFMLFLHFAFYTPTHGRWREPQKGWEGVTCSKASVLFVFFESHHLSAQTLTWLRDGAWSHTARLTLCCVVVFAASLAAASGSLLFFCSPGLWPQHSDAKSPWWHPRWLAEHPLSTPLWLHPLPLLPPRCLATAVPLDFLYVQADSLKRNFATRTGTPLSSPSLFF